MAKARSHTPLQKTNLPELEKAPQTPGEVVSSFAQEAFSSLAKFGGDFFDQILGTRPSTPEADWYTEQQKQRETAFKPLPRERTTLFSLREQREQREIQQIKELLNRIREEIKYIQKAGQSMQQELAGAEKLVLETDPKGGVYHLRFLEVILKLLQIVRAKIGESGAWLSMFRGKPKRGSAFTARSKKQGTQYSMSQELSIARSAQ